ncbi:MAG: bi-domain-containing oxidoreductase [Thermoproteota archaeon]|nr:bi-domain-containing oxidoreductase [Candidatus Brockarchaeota archaeon]
MKQVIYVRRNIKIEEVPVPIIGDNEVLVANVASCISIGTEIRSISLRSKNIVKIGLDIVKKNPELIEKLKSIMKSYGIIKSYHIIRERINEPYMLGYSSAGVVVEVGKNVEHVKVGDRVACGGTGYAVHAEFIRVPKNLCVKVPENVSFEEAAFTTIGAIALQGIRRADAKIGERIGVIGLGLIGLLTTQILKAAGCKVIGFDLNKDKVELARKVGADASYKADDVDTIKMAELFSDGVGLDAVIIAATSASSKPINDALKMIRKKGKVIVVGDVSIAISRESFYEKEADILISTSYGPGRYDPLYEEKGIDYPISYVRWTEQRNMETFLELLSSRKIDVKSLITHVFSVEQASKAYESANSGNAIGIILKYAEWQEQRPLERIVKLPYINELGGSINVGIIGAGNFTRLVLLPNLLKIPGLKISSICALTGPKLKYLAEKYKIGYITTDYRNIINDSNTDLVIVTTRHNLHAKIAMEALNLGKHVYVEKPLAINIDELKNVIQVAENSKGILFVGFNRRFSPFTYRLKETLSKTAGPMMINYIVNAGSLPAEYWIYDPEEGGGRIVGECVHFFDLMNYIIDSDPVEISIMPIDSHVKTIKSSDNMVVSIKYKNGSVGNLIYTSIGSPAYPKEVIHVQRSGLVIEVNDFKELVIHEKKKKRMSARMQDKGHYNELVRLIEGIKTGISPIPLKDIYIAHEIAFKVNDMAWKK